MMQLGLVPKYRETYNFMIQNGPVFIDSKQVGIYGTFSSTYQIQLKYSASTDLVSSLRIAQQKFVPPFRPSPPPPLPLLLPSKEEKCTKNITPSFR